MADLGGSLDGLGLLALVAPSATSFGILKAQVQSERGIDTLYVLTISTPNGAHVTYWSRESVDALVAALTQATTGIEVAREFPDAMYGPQYLADVIIPRD